MLADHMVYSYGIFILKIIVITKFKAVNFTKYFKIEVKPKYEIN